MKRFFASAVFLLSSVCAYATLPNGIYLVADSVSEKIFGNRATAEVNDAYGKLVRVKDLPGPAFGDTDLGSVVYDYRMFYKNGKPYVPYAFIFTARHRGEYRVMELMEKKAPFTFVLLIDGVSVASGPFFYDKTAIILTLESFCSYATVQASVTAWDRHLRAHSDWMKDTTFCGENVLRYISGLPARQDLYWNGEHLTGREWYPDGKLKTSFDRIPGTPSYAYEREYDPGGNLISWRCRSYPSPYEYYYSRYYAADGTLLYVDSSYTSGGTSYSIEYGYDSTGALSYRLKKKYLDPLPDENNFGSETNWPQLIEERAYENGKLVSSGQSYSACDICETYEAGTWSYYKNGKVIRTETFEDWRVRDARMRQEALAALQKRQKKKRK